METWKGERDAWLQWNKQPWSEQQQREYVRRFANTIERWLDAGEGKCVLRQPQIARIVGKAFSQFDGSRCDQHSWVIMPNHVHLLFSLRDQQPLPDLRLSWKGYTSRAINKLRKRSGALWQKDYYDRLIRNEDHFWNCAKYIRKNPEKGRLRAGEYLFFESAFVRETLGAAASKPPTSLLNPKLGGLEAAAPSHA